MDPYVVPMRTPPAASRCSANLFSAIIAWKASRVMKIPSVPSTSPLPALRDMCCTATWNLPWYWAFKLHQRSPSSLFPVSFGFVPLLIPNCPHFFSADHLTPHLWPAARDISCPTSPTRHGKAGILFRHAPARNVAEWRQTTTRQVW